MSHYIVGGGEYFLTEAVLWMEILSQTSKQVLGIKDRGAHISYDHKWHSWVFLKSVRATSVVAAALRGQEIKFGIYFDMKFRAFSVSPLTQPVICGVQRNNFDNKLKVPVEKLFGALWQRARR